MLTCVYESEEINIVRLGDELLQSHEIQDNHDETAKAISKKYIINKQKQSTTTPVKRCMIIF